MSRKPPEAAWLDLEFPGGSECVRDALAKPPNPNMMRFVARFSERATAPGSHFSYDRVIEAPSREAAERLARQWAREKDDDLNGITPA
jgi:hypothetical protein